VCHDFLDLATAFCVVLTTETRHFSPSGMPPGCHHKNSYSELNADLQGCEQCNRVFGPAEHLLAYCSKRVVLSANRDYKRPISSYPLALLAAYREYPAHSEARPLVKGVF
jgi:hypothetical protein